MRCFGDGDPLYERYHDTEWGFPVREEQALFERICLEAFQSGLAWITILRKREGFRAAFAGFDPEQVAAFGDDDVARLMGDAGIVRNRAKIEAAIANARAVLRLREEGVDLAELVWSFAPAQSSRPAADEPQRPAGDHRRVESAREGAEAARLPVRRPDDRLRRDAGLRPRQRPRRRLPDAAAREQARRALADRAAARLPLQAPDA